MQFYGPAIKSIIFALASFVCAFVTSLVTEAWLIDSLVADQSSTTIEIYHDWRLSYNFYLWYLIVFAAAVYWARYDIRYDASVREQEVDKVESIETPDFQSGG